MDGWEGVTAWLFADAHIGQIDGSALTFFLCCS